MTKSNMMLALMVFVYSIAGTLHVHADWKADHQLTTSSITPQLSHNFSRSVATDYAGNVHVVWFDDRDGTNQIFYIRSTNAGVKWNPSQRLSSSISGGEHPAVATDGSSVYAAWHGTAGAGTGIFFRRSIDWGSRWAPEVQLRTRSTSAKLPVLAASDGLLHLVFTDSRSGVTQVRYAVSKDHGVTWSPTAVISPEDQNAFTGTVSASGSRVCVAWIASDPETGGKNAFCRYSSNGGKSWSTVTKLANSVNNTWSPSLAVFGHTVHAAWFQQGQGDDEGIDAERYLDEAMAVMNLEPIESAPAEPASERVAVPETTEQRIAGKHALIKSTLRARSDINPTISARVLGLLDEYDQLTNPASASLDDAERKLNAALEIVAQRVPGVLESLQEASGERVARKVEPIVVSKPDGEKREIPATYTVVAGDMLSRLAERFYGSAGRWVDIYRANPDIDPQRLRVGDVLTLPQVDDRSVSRFVPESRESSTNVPPIDKGGSSVDTYVIRDGDNLHLIAFRLLGDANRWLDIARANPEVDILTAPAGTVLRIPRQAASTPSGFITPPAISGSPSQPVVVSSASVIPETYVVKQGDTLSGIARRIYKDVRKWIDISNANPNVDPLVLVPGSVLKLPQPKSQAPAPSAPAVETPLAPLPVIPDAGSSTTPSLPTSPPATPGDIISDPVIPGTSWAPPAMQQPGFADYANRVSADGWRFTASRNQIRFTNNDSDSDTVPIVPSAPKIEPNVPPATNEYGYPASVTPILPDPRPAVVPGATEATTEAATGASVEAAPLLAEESVPSDAGEAAAVVPSEPTEADLRPRTYEVQSGDTLSSIARDIYGDGNLWVEIYRANGENLPNPSYLRPGMVIIIPSKVQLEAIREADAAQSTEATPEPVDTEREVVTEDVRTRIDRKIERLQAALPQYLENGGDREQIQALIREFRGMMAVPQIATDDVRERKLDQALVALDVDYIVGESEPAPATSRLSRDDRVKQKMQAIQSALPQWIARGGSAGRVEALIRSFNQATQSSAKGWNVYYRRSDDNSHTWSTPILLTSVHEHARQPNLIATEDGTLHVVWSDQRNGSTEVYYKYSLDGNDWSDDIRLTNTPAGSNRPFIASQSKALHVIWLDERTGKTEVFYKRFAPY